MSVLNWETSREGVGRWTLSEPRICDHPYCDVSWHTGGFLAPALRIRGVGDGVPLAHVARTRWVTGRNGLRRSHPIRTNQRRILNDKPPRPTG